MSRSPRDSRREGLFLGTVAALPLVPYLLHFARDGAARFAVKGDFAALELQTRLAMTGDVLLGPYSRYKFAHPGPLYFYVLAPLYKLTGGSSAAVPLGACAIGAVAAFATVYGARLLGRAHGVAAILAVLAWLAAFGNVCATSWNPMVVVLPLAAYFVLAAAFACGHTRAAVPAAFFGVLAAETHLACVLTVAGVGTAALGAHLGWRRRQPDRPSWRPLAVAAALLAIALLPPLLEQLRNGDQGNLTKLLRTFLHREEPMKSWSRAVRNLFLAVDWLPDRLTQRTLLEEGLIPRVMGWDPVPDEASTTVIRLAFFHLLLVGAAFVVAKRRRDGPGAVLLSFAVLAELLGIVSLRSALGIDYRYLVFWTSAATTVAWLAAFAVLFGAVSSKVRLPRRAPEVFLGAMVVAALACGHLQRVWIGHNHPAPKQRPGLQTIYEHLRAELRARGAQPVLHIDGAWELDVAFQLELARDGITAFVHDDERWIFGPKPPSWTTATKPLHVWASLPRERPKGEACLTRIVEAPAFEDHPPPSLWVSETDPTACATVAP